MQASLQHERNYQFGLRKDEEPEILQGKTLIGRYDSETDCLVTTANGRRYAVPCEAVAWAKDANGSAV
jgi:hypothetical protein